MLARSSHSKDNSHEKEHHDDHEDDDEKDEHCCGNVTNGRNGFIPALQYVNGAIMVRDAFYIEAKRPNGITVLNNDPRTYSQIQLSTSSARSGQLQVYPVARYTSTYPSNGSSSGTGNGGANSGGNSPGSNGNAGGAGNNNGGAANPGSPILNSGAQWVEIRPQ